MAALPDRARVVVIGAGIVGNSMAYHLARLGWRDIVLVEKGTLPSPGGSTGHASNFIFLTDHSGDDRLHGRQRAPVQELGVFTGGIEVADWNGSKAQAAWRRPSRGASGLITPDGSRRWCRSSTRRRSCPASTRRGGSRSLEAGTLMRQSAMRDGRADGLAADR
jgi:choline dehydrogenase-like flavoprotein